MSFSTNVNPPGGGIGFGTNIVRATNRTGVALAIGNLVQFDIHRAAAESTSTAEGNAASVLANVTGCAGGSVFYGLYGIAMQAAADNAELDVMVQGKVRCTVEAATAFAVGRRMSVGSVTGDVKMGDLAVGAHKRIGLLLEAHSASPTAQSLLVLFDGVHGFE